MKKQGMIKQINRIENFGYVLDLRTREEWFFYPDENHLIKRGDSVTFTQDDDYKTVLVADDLQIIRNRAA